MVTLLRELRRLFVSLETTVVLIALSIVLVLVATLDQVNLGAWAVQEKYFHTFAVFWRVGPVSLAVFPGGYTLGGLLVLNLVAAHLARFEFTWRRAGLHLVHGGLVLLLVGELLTSLWQDEYQLRLDEGRTKAFVESVRSVELALTETGHADFDEVVAIPEARLIRREIVQHPSLPFRVAVRAFYPNAALHRRALGAMAGNALLASRGVGTQLVAVSLPAAQRGDEPNAPGAEVELIGPDGPIGTWLVSVGLEQPQPFAVGDRRWTIALRFARRYQPFSLTLLKFSHDRHAGTDIPKNFSSRLRLRSLDGREDREVLISMNQPLRHAGLTFYQAGFENNDTTSVLQVVRNPSWLLPYVACAMMTTGLLWQFGLPLVRFVRRRPGARAAA